MVGASLVREKNIKYCCQPKGAIVISHQHVQTLVAISRRRRRDKAPLHSPLRGGEHQKSICAVHCGDSPAPHTASWLPVTSAATRPRLRSGHGGTHGGAGEEAHQRSQRYDAAASFSFALNSRAASTAPAKFRGT